MVEISPEHQIKALICPGRTYLFKAQEHQGDKQHFHVVLNVNPRADSCLVMVTATTITTKHVSDYWSRLAELGVLVQATASEADFIKHPTLFRCDEPIVQPLDVIISKLANGELLQKDAVKDPLLSKLRTGLLNSKTVSEEVKAMVRAS